MRLPAAVDALAERPFRLLWFGRTTSGIGDALVPVALAFGVLETTGSAGDLGIVLAAQTLAHVGFILVGGVWADRLERRRVMLAADALRAASQGTLAALLLSGPRAYRYSSRRRRSTAPPRASFARPRPD